MRSLLLFLAAVPAFAGGAYTCVNGGSDPTAINSLLSSGGTTTLSGTCALGPTKLQLTASGTILTGTATLNYTGSGYAIQINGSGTSGSPITVNGLTLNNAAIETTQNSMSTPQMWLAITNNVIQNVTNGANGLIQDGYWSHVLVQNNQFNTISTVPFSQVTTNTNVENCTGCAPGTPDNYPCSWSGGTNNCFGGGIDLENGYDNTIIDSNTFNFTLGDAMRIPNVWLISSGTSIRIANNNQITNNRMINIHRMGIEANGGAGCIGTCLFGNYALQTNKVYKDNYISNYLAPYGNSFAWAIGDGSSNPIVANNSSIANTGPGAYGYELGYFGVVQFQGNTTTANTDGLGSNWTTYIMTGDSQPTTLYQNNYSAGPLAGGGAYFGQEGGCSGCFTQQYNVTAGACDTPTSCTTSNATSGIVSFSNSGGTATLNTWVKSQIAIRYTQFFLDSSTTPFVTQELCNISTTFSSDRHWLYGASMSTSGLTGTHTIKAVATDLNGGTTTQTQSFTTGSGPVASFSPTTLAYGVITLGSTSSPQTTTLTNSGTTTLTISSGPSLTGTNAGDFAITGTTCTSTLAASATCTVTATFHPLALGSRFAFITIVDNASGSPHQVQLTGGASICQAGNIITNCDFGTGVITPWGFNGGSIASVAIDSTGPNGGFAAHITATSSVPPGSNIELFQDNLTFGANGTMMQAQYDCKSSRTQLVNVLGILSVSPFTSYGLSYMQTFPTSYSGTYPTCKSPFFKVQGSPTSGSGRFTTQTDNAIGGDQLYTTNVNLVPVGSVPASQLSATSATFGAQNVGTTQTGSVITVTNGGIANLVISSIAYSGGNASDFGQTNTCSTVTPGSTCTITPTFTPTSTGSRVSNLVITSNDSSVSPQTIPASGTGMASSSEVTAITFPFIGHGSFSVAFTTVSNSTNDRVRYGTVPCILAPTANNTNTWLQTNFLANVLSSYARLAVGGLGASTQYYVCPEVSKDSGVTWSTGAQATITTATLPVVHPAMPLPPLDFNSDYPDVSAYATLNVNSACSNTDFGNAYTTAVSNWATQGTIIKVAHGGNCGAGPYAFSQMPPDVFKFTSAAISLPSTINWPSHGFNENDLVLFGRTYATVVTYPSSTSCDVGFGSLAPGGIQSGMRYQVHVVDSNNIQIRCLPMTQVDPGFANPAPPIMVFTDTGSITGTQFFLAVPFKTTHNDANGNPIWERRLLTSPYNVTPYIIIQSDGNLPPEHTQVTPAWASQLFSFTDPVSNITNGNSGKPFIIFGDPDPNVEIPEGPYRIVGAEITTQDYNASVHSSDPWFWNYVYATRPWDSEIICDRCYYHMLGAPNREFIGMNWDGSNLGWLDSYKDNLTYFHANTTMVPSKTSSSVFAETAGSAYTGFAPIAFAGGSFTVGGSGGTSVIAGTYTSGVTATGVSGQTCLLSSFNGGGSGAQLRVALTGTNTIASGSALIPGNNGVSFTSSPTSATASSESGQATCSGTAVVATTRGSRVLIGNDLVNANALKAWGPAGITVTGNGIVTSTTSGNSNESCNASEPGWPKTGNGEITVAQWACVDVTNAGAILTVTAANAGISLWNAEGDDAMLGGFGPGPYKVVDGFSDGAGIQWFWNDAGNERYRGNYIFNRNYVKQSLKYMHGSSTSDGLFYFDRQPMEWKGGQKLLLKGNFFSGTWREDIPDTGFFAIQPLTGGQVTDVNFISNTLAHGSAVLQGPTNTCGGSGGDPCSGPSIRIHIGNLLTEDINGYVYAAHNPNGNDGFGLGWENQLQGLEDFTVDHVTDTVNRGATPWIASLTQQATEGYSDTNSFHWFSGVPAQTNTNYQDGSGGTDTPPGCGGLSNVAFMNCSFTPIYNFSQNVLLGGYNDTSVPSGQSTTSAMMTAFSGLTNSFLATGTVAGTSTAINWLNPTTDANANYCLAPASSYKAGSNPYDKSADFGIDCNALRADQGWLVLDGTPANGITTTGFHVSYVAPDSGICYVLYSTTNDITTAAQVADSGGARARSTAITGLSTHTHFYYWVLGSGNSVLSQQSGQVWTN